MLKKIMTGLTIGAFLFSAHAMAGNVEAVKKAKGPKDLVSSQTANVQLRHYAMANANGDNVENYWMMTQARANFSFGLLNDKVSSTLTLGAHKLNDSTVQVKQRRPQIWTDFYMFQSTYFDFTPYSNIRTPQGGAGTSIVLGVFPEFKAPKANTIFGTLSLSSGVSAEMSLSSKPEDRTVVNIEDNDRAARFGITKVKPEAAEGKIEDAKNEPSYWVMYMAKASLDASKLVKGLGVKAMIEYYNIYDPVTEIDEDGTRNTYFTASRETATYYEVSYKLTDVLSFTNRFITGHNGFYQSRLNGMSPQVNNTRFCNLAYLTYTLY